MEPLRFCLYLYQYILISLVQYPTTFAFINNNNNNNMSMNHHVCRQDESQLLLQLKQELPPVYPDRYYKTKHWNGSRDCCQWDAVTCDYFTGHVISLDLSNLHKLNLTGNSFSNTRLSGELKPNSSLFRLTHLHNLNLAFNNFSGSTLPSEFGRLNALTHLNLSGTRFGGQLPKEFYHLSNLISLDLSSDRYSDGVMCDVKMLFGNMTRIRVLVLEYQNLSGSELPINMSSFLTHLDLANTGLQGNIPATIFEKPNLQFLHLNENPGLKGSLPKSLNRSNLLSINRLDLRWTSISGSLPDSIGLMTNLYYMDLAETSISGRLPDSIGLLSSLNHMDISWCRLWGPIPESIGNITAITSMDLSWNQLQGQLPDAFSGFQSLTRLDLNSNNLEGRIPSSLTNMSKLESLLISSNALTGPFPSRAGHRLQHLKFIDLSNNSIHGMIPPWMFFLPSLEELYLSSNRFTGQIWKPNSQTLGILDLSSNRLNIELQSVYNISSIQYINISHNIVTEHDAGDVANVTFPYLRILDMSSCEIKEFPNFLRSRMPSLETLDLSNNNIHGPIPSWFTSNPFPSLNSLDFSYNSLTYVGVLPWKHLQYLDLHSNSLRLTFPLSISNMSDLVILNLSHNKISGNILECLANASTQLYVLDLRENEFHGKIPTFGDMPYLTNLGLNGNSFEGPFPPSLANCTNLEVIDLGNNMLQDTFPGWLHTLPYLEILILKSNSFHGPITSPALTNNSFSNLHIFDLSYNNFTGLLPEKLFASLEAIKHHNQASLDGGLYMSSGRGAHYDYSVTLSVKGKDVILTKVLKIFTTIDLSSNNFEGHIPESMSYLVSLRLLNLSNNNIHGSIPPGLGRIFNLEQLDLSSNQLTGGIPQTLTNLTFLEALNLSHNHLVGPIPVANQFLTFSNESYVGNQGLCGAPLTRSCGNKREPQSSEEVEKEDEEDGFMMGFTWKAVVMGYGCGIVLGFILGSVMLSIEKPKWLAKFVYVEAAIILSKPNKRRQVVQRRR